MSNLGKPFSVRLEAGHAEEIKRLSGRPPGEVLRQLAAAWLARARADRAGAPESKLDREITITAGRLARTDCKHLSHTPDGKCLGCGEQHQPLPNYGVQDEQHTAG